MDGGSRKAQQPYYYDIVTISRQAKKAPPDIGRDGAEVQGGATPKGGNEVTGGLWWPAHERGMTAIVSLRSGVAGSAIPEKASPLRERCRISIA